MLLLLVVVAGLAEAAPTVDQALPALPPPVVDAYVVEAAAENTAVLDDNDALEAGVSPVGLQAAVESSETAAVLAAPADDEAAGLAAADSVLLSAVESGDPLLPTVFEYRDSQAGHAHKQAGQPGFQVSTARVQCVRVAWGVGGGVGIGERFRDIVNIPDGTCRTGARTDRDGLSIEWARAKELTEFYSTN